MTKYKTAESVRRGHPDKLCDLIADSILDECLRHDRYSRCACEVMATKGKIFVCGEITCAAKINIRSVVREVLRKVGYGIPTSSYMSTCGQGYRFFGFPVDKLLEAHRYSRERMKHNERR